MRVYITGGTGNIGQNVTAALPAEVSGEPIHSFKTICLVKKPPRLGRL